MGSLGFSEAILNPSKRHGIWNVRPIFANVVEEGESVHAEEEDLECGECGVRKPLKFQDPLKPSQTEIDEHNLTHSPYRSWCKHCVRGRKKELPHFKKVGDAENLMSEYHFDFAFPGEEAGFHARCGTLCGWNRRWQFTKSATQRCLRLCISSCKGTHTNNNKQNMSLF